MRLTIAAMVLVVVGCRPRPTDTSTMKDLNPCQEGEILASNGECESGGTGGSDTGN